MTNAGVTDPTPEDLAAARLALHDMIDGDGYDVGAEQAERVIARAIAKARAAERYRIRQAVVDLRDEYQPGAGGLSLDTNRGARVALAKVYDALGGEEGE